MAATPDALDDLAGLLAGWSKRLADALAQTSYQHLRDEAGAVCLALLRAAETADDEAQRRRAEAAA